MEQRVQREVSVKAMRGWVLLPQVPLGQQHKDAGSENSQECYPHFVGRKQKLQSHSEESELERLRLYIPGSFQGWELDFLYQICSGPGDKRAVGQPIPQERKHRSAGDSSLSASPNHFPWTLSFSLSLVWFLLFPPSPHLPSPFSKGHFHFLLSLCPPPYPTPSSLLCSHVPSSTLGSPPGGCACLGCGCSGRKGFAINVGQLSWLLEDPRA